MRTFAVLYLFVSLVTSSLAVSLEAIQDNSVYCDPNNPNLIENDTDTLSIKRKFSADYSRKVWIRFDLSSTTYSTNSSTEFSIVFTGMNFTPVASDILLVNGLKSGFSPPSGILGTNWNANALTWNNAPGNNIADSYRLDSSSTSEIGRLVLNSTTLTAGQELKFRISRIGDYLQADGTVTIILSLASYANGNEISFASSSHTNYDGPEIDIEDLNISLTANDVSESSVQLSWNVLNNNSNISYYKVFRDDECISTTTLTGMNDTGLNKYRSYEYYIWAYNNTDDVIEKSDILAYGYKRFPFFVRPKATQNGITDMSFLTTGKAEYFVTAVGSDLYANGQRIRFLGVNMASQACFPVASEAEIFAAHFVKMGVNCVRIHGIDRIKPYGVFADLPSSDPGYMKNFDADQLAKLDYFIYQLKEKGIYVDFELHQSRVYPGLPLVGTKNYPGLDIFYPSMISMQKEYANELLNHTNPHTNIKYKDEPAVAFIEINNENGLLHEWFLGKINYDLPEDYTTELEQQWRSWLSAKYTTTVNLREAWLPAGGYQWNEEISKNSKFSAGMSNWVCQVVPPATAVSNIESGTAPDGSNAIKIDVSNVGNYGWHVQLYQPNLHVIKNIPYTVSFWAKAESTREINACLQMNLSPYTKHGEVENFVLSTDWEEYKFVVTPEQSDTNCRLNISNLGLATGKVWLANCSVKQGNTMQSSSSLSAEILSQTEIITNGSFANSLSNWSTYVSSPANASFTVEANAGPQNENAMKVNVTTADTVDKWHVKFHQLIANVSKRQPYIISFWAKADQSRIIRAGLYSNSSPWVISELKEVLIGTQWKEFKVVVCPDANENNVRVSFTDLAAQTGTIWFTNISVKMGIKGLEYDETLWGMHIFDKTEFASRTKAAQKDWIRFLYDTEKKYYTDMKNYIKNVIGAKGLIIGSQTYFSPSFIQAEMDVVDTHFYVAHPFDYSDSLNWYFKNYSMAGHNWFNFAARNAPLAIADKPFVCTEYNQPNPNTFGGEAYLLASAYASMQDWDAVFAFNFYTYPTTSPSEYFHHFFAMCQEPAKVITFPAAASMLRRQDVSTPNTMWNIALSEEDFITKMIQKDTESVGGNDFGFSNLNALRFPVAITKANQTSFAKNLDTLPDTMTSTTQELVWNSNSKLVHIKSPLSKAVIGKAGQQSHDLGNGVFVTTTSTIQPGDWVALSMTVKEGSSFTANGAKILITAVGYTENTRMIWKDGMGPEAYELNQGTSSVGNKWGKAPVLMEGIKAIITLNGLSASDIKVWALDEDGARKTSVPVSNLNSSAVFEINKSYKSPWYEVVIDIQ